MKSFRSWLKRNRRRRLWESSIEYFSPAAGRRRWLRERVFMRTGLLGAVSVSKVASARERVDRTAGVTTPFDLRDRLTSVSSVATNVRGDHAACARLTRFHVLREECNDRGLLCSSRDGWRLVDASPSTQLPDSLSRRSTTRACF
jgi:hypothetical protein